MSNTDVSELSMVGTKCTCDIQMRRINSVSLILPRNHANALKNHLIFILII